MLEGGNKQLIWDFTTSASKYFVTFSRLRGANLEQIATRTESSSYDYLQDSYKTDYTASLPATLLLKEVKRDEEYVYIIKILNGLAAEVLKDQVTVEVVAKFKL